MSGVIFVVNRYEYLMENKNIIKTFCDCKPLDIYPHQNFTGSYKNFSRYWMSSKICRILKKREKR